MPVEVFRDTFNRADGALGNPDVGTRETHLRNAQITIQGNAARFQNTGNFGVAAMGVTTGKTHHGIFVKCGSTNNDGNTGQWIAVRAATVNGSIASNTTTPPSVYVAMPNSGGTGYGLIYPGVNTTITGPAWVPGQEIGLVSAGDYVQLFFGTRLAHQFQHTSYVGQTAAMVGAWSANGGGTLDVKFDDVRITSAQSSALNPGMSRMGYDKDGTIVYVNSASGYRGATNWVGTVSQANLAYMNDALGSTMYTLPSPYGAGWQGEQSLAWAFPEPRSITGIFAALNPPEYPGSNYVNVYYSTQPVGTPIGSVTWTGMPNLNNTVLSSSGVNSAVNPEYRTRVKWTEVNNVTFVYAGTLVTNVPLNIHAVHIYGGINQNSNIHRVAFWHPYLDQPLHGTALDMDDVIRGQVVYREFRIKNMSTVYTMNNIVLDLESIEYGTALTDEFSIKRASESTYGPNTTVSSLAIGAISEIISVRRIVGTSAPYRLDSLRVRSQIGSLSL